MQTFEARSIDELEPAFDAMASAGMQAVSLMPMDCPIRGEQSSRNWQLSVIWHYPLIREKLSTLAR